MNVYSRSVTARAIIGVVAIGGLFAIGRTATAQDDRPHLPVASTTPPRVSPGEAAIEQAAGEGRYLFIFFWRTDDEPTLAMDGVLREAVNKWSRSARRVGVNISDPNERPVVARFGMDRAPMPMILALAPNGAVTKALPLRCTEEQLGQALVSPGTAKCMKALQDRKLVLLCVQNQRTQFSQAALRGAFEFKADARFAKATEIVTIDPTDRQETGFLQTLQVDPNTSTATTVLLSPPGQPIARFVGAVTKEQIVAKVQAGPCAGGQCGPGGCCGPQK